MRERNGPEIPDKGEDCNRNPRPCRAGHSFHTPEGIAELEPPESRRRIQSLDEQLPIPKETMS
jgi:hypothetical protein